MEDLTQHIADQTLSASSALAGLILVFLGAITAAYESYDPPARKSVRKKFRRRAFIALAGLVAALISAGLAMTSNWFRDCFAFVSFSVVLLALAGLATLISAVQSFLDID